MSLIFKTPLNAKNTTTKGSQNIYGYPGCDLVEGSAEYTENGEYTLEPEEADGFSSVEIKVAVPSDVHNQEKEATPTTSSQEITPDENYTGLSKVTIAGVTASIDANITAGNIKKDVEILGVIGSYDPQPNLDTLNVTPSTSAQTLTPTSPVDGFDEVVVSAVTSSIDANIAAGNIKKDVTILGVTGNYDPQPDLEAKTVNSSTVQQVITPTAGKDGLSSVTVEPYVLQAKTATPTTSQQVIEPDNDKDGLSSVTVSAVTSAIDANIAAGNIKDGVTILGVTGDYTGGGTNVPDWSSIGWSSQDVINSNIVDDVAYTATVMNNNSWKDDKILRFAPKQSDSQSGEIFSGCYRLTFAPDFTLTDTAAPLYQMFYNCTTLDGVGSISRPNAINTSYANQAFEGCPALRKVGTVDMNHITQAIKMFNGCSSLPSVTLTNTSSITDFTSAFSGCTALTSITIPDLSSVTTMERMFQNAIVSQSLATQIGSWDTSSVTDFNSMFSDNSAYHSQAQFAIAPAFDMSSAENVSSMFNSSQRANANLTTIPQYDWGKVKDITVLFGNYGCDVLTTVGGFINLGKAFLSTDSASSHLLDFVCLSASYYAHLDKTSLMNIINNIAAPDDTACTDATIRLHSSVYALLDPEDIAIATAKNWTITSV